MPRAAKRKAEPEVYPPMPAAVERSEYKAAKWREITGAHRFREADVPTLALLVSWHQIVDQCMDDITVGGDDVQVAYSNDMGDIKALPQIQTMKTASAEIRALNKQLGIVDGRDVDGGADGGGDEGYADVLRLVQGNRQARRQRSAV